VLVGSNPKLKLRTNYPKLDGYDLSCGSSVAGRPRVAHAPVGEVAVLLGPDALLERVHGARWPTTFESSAQLDSATRL